MGWVEDIGRAIDYIESSITEEHLAEKAAEKANISPFYFQKGFSMLCGMTVGEYIRKRRLALAGGELASTDTKIIDIALKYGYDSPDSFTKAFTRFHGVTPSAVRRNGAALKAFAPLKIKFSLEGGYVMDYKIIEKAPFTVIGRTKTFSYENGQKEVPMFWKEHYEKGGGKYVCGMYGINIDESMGSDKFEYIIADDYTEDKTVPEGFITKEIPGFTWAVFPCVGPMPKAMQEVQNKIYSEWLPSAGYDIAAGYNIEMYNDPKDYPKGTLDEKYYSEVWIPVRKK